jgi:hypothetical protein
LSNHKEKAGRGGGRGGTKGKGGTKYLSKEEWNALTAEEKDAIRAARDTAGVGKKRKIAKLAAEAAATQLAAAAAAAAAAAPVPAPAPAAPTAHQAGVGVRMTQRVGLTVDSCSGKGTT